MHDLSGAHWRHRRAKEHVAHVKRLAESLRSEGKVVLPPDAEAESGDGLVELPAAENPGDDLRIRVGEAVYNFRAALDYSVHVASGGEGQSQFPIESKRERFEARKTGCLSDGKYLTPYLKGVGTREGELTKAVQPCEGVDWTRRLATLSNKDKHRELVVVNAISGQPFRRSDFPALYPSEDL